MPERIRQSSIPFFFEAGEGRILLKAVHAVALSEVSYGLAEIEPNWYQLEINFLSEEVPDFATRSPHEEDGCRLTFDFTPQAVRLKGPMHGVTDVTVDISALLSEPLLATLRLFCELRDEYTFDLYNPNHQIEFIEERTIIVFSDGSRGVVQNVQGGGSRFDVRRGANDVRRYQLPALYAEIRGHSRLQEHGPRALGVLYAP